MSFYENLSAAKQNSNWGFVNKKQKWIIETIYKNVSFFLKGYALVLKSNKDYVFINKKGEECQVGDIQSAYENKIMRCDCKQNNIWFGRV